jgi:hypothetical protein
MVRERIGPGQEEGLLYFFGKAIFSKKISELEKILV